MMAEEIRLQSDDSKSNPLLVPSRELLHDDKRGAFQRTKKSRSWRKLTEFVKTGEVLLAGDIARPKTPITRTDSNLDESESRRMEKEITINLKRWHFHRMMNFSLTQVFMALLLHVVLAIIAFSFIFHQWTIIDSIYFAITTFTTVGYGDLFPESPSARIFTCVYSLAGVTCLGIAIGVVSGNIAEAQERALLEAREHAKNRAFALFTDKSFKESAEMDSSSCSHSTQKVSWVDSWNKLQQRLEQFFRPRGAMLIVLSFSAVLLVLLLFGVVIARDPAIEPSDVAYFLVVTSTTLGFGDIAPSSQAGRLATAIFIPLAVGTMGHWLAIVANFIVELRQSRLRQQHFELEGISLADLQAMDADDDGHVSRAEFLEFMLLAMNKVEKSLLEELRGQFDRLDADKSGWLSKGDLIEIARRKLKQPKRKLELSRYKRKLLRQASQAKKKEVSWFYQPGISLMNMFQIDSVDRSSAPRVYPVGSGDSLDRRGTNANGMVRVDTGDSMFGASPCGAGNDVDGLFRGDALSQQGQCSPEAINMFLSFDSNDKVGATDEYHVNTGGCFGARSSGSVPDVVHIPTVSESTSGQLENASCPGGVVGNAVSIHDGGDQEGHRGSIPAGSLFDQMEECVDHQQDIHSREVI